MVLQTFRSGLCKAFTLIELLTVVAVILVLARIMLPVVSRTRYDAKNAACISNLHQWGIAVTLYANDNQRMLPRFDLCSGNNTWDISSFFLPAMRQYGITEKQWVCPVDTRRPEEIIRWMDAYADFAQNPHMQLFEYCWWVPRRCGAILFPPGYPTSLSDPSVSTLPIMSDSMGNPGNEPTDVQLVARWNMHNWNRRILNTNILFADAHVEQVPASGIKNRYDGNWHNYH